MSTVIVGRALSALAILFLAFDTGVKLAGMSVVAETLSSLGYPADLGFTIGVVELVCLVLYAVPRTAVLGDAISIARSGVPTTRVAMMRCAWAGRTPLERPG